MSIDVTAVHIDLTLPQPAQGFLGEMLAHQSQTNTGWHAIKHLEVDTHMSLSSLPELSRHRLQSTECIKPRLMYFSDGFIARRERLAR